jgi:hypothetical protein
MQVDTILAHGTVIAMDDAFTLIEDGAVALATTRSRSRLHRSDPARPHRP